MGRRVLAGLVFTAACATTLCLASDTVVTDSRAVNTNCTRTECDFGEEVRWGTNQGRVFLFSSDLELTTDSYRRNEDQVVGLRFRALGIPNGVVVESAKIQFEADIASSGSLSLELLAHEAGSSPAFSRTAFNLSARSPLTSAIAWNPPAWVHSHEVSSRTVTPNLRTMLQTVVMLEEWTEESAFVVLVRRAAQDTSTNTRTAHSGRTQGSMPPTLVFSFRPGSHYNGEPQASAMSVGIGVAASAGVLLVVWVVLSVRGSSISRDSVHVLDDAEPPRGLVREPSAVLHSAPQPLGAGAARAMHTGVIWF